MHKFIVGNVYYITHPQPNKTLLHEPYIFLYEYDGDSREWGRFLNIETTKQLISKLDSSWQPIITQSLAIGPIIT